MASCKSSCCQNRSSLCRWCSLFEKTPPIISPAEQNARAGFAVEAGALDDQIAFFMRDAENPINCDSRIRHVKEFCNDARSKEGDIEARQLAFVYEFPDGSEMVPSQLVQKIFNGTQFFEYLSGIHAQKDPDDSAQDPQSTGISSVRKKSSDWQFMFIANLDRSAVLTFVQAASASLAWALHDSVYNHLAHEALMKVTISQPTVAAFRLTMDLPYFALRSSDTPILDTHLRGNGKSLRQCEDVTFLKAEPSDSLSRHYLYEAHFSCIVSGTHNSRWKACAFGDTYHENEVQDLEPDPTNPEQGLEDPMRPNKLMDNVIMDPRHYYLDVFAAQIRYISGEWREIRDHVCHNTNDSKEYYRSKLDNTGPDSDLSQSAERWINKSLDLIRKVATKLSSTSDYWEVFNRQSEAYFGNMDESPDKIQIIRDVFFELDAFAKDFKRLKEDIMEERARYQDQLEKLRMDEIKAAAAGAQKHAHKAEDLHQKQNQHAEHGMMMASVMMVISVFGLTSQVFSIQKGNNLVPLSFGYIVLMLVIFGTIAKLLHIFLVYRVSFRDLFGSLKEGALKRIEAMRATDRAAEPVTEV